MDKNNNICFGETLFPDCPVRNILARVGDKWSLLLMHQMMHHQEPMRFSDLKKAIPDISQKVLTSTLRKLGTFTIIESKASKNPKLSKGQNASRSHVTDGNQTFEVRSYVPEFNLQPNEKIAVSNYITVFKK